VLPVEVRAGLEGDEELRSIGVWTRISHAKDTSSSMWQGWMKFVRELFAENRDTSSACSIGISSVDHEVLNQPMKLGVLKIASLTHFDEILACLRDLIAAQLYLKHPLISEQVDPPCPLS
jgi:hypothetical protein